MVCIRREDPNLQQTRRRSAVCTQTVGRDSVLQSMKVARRKKTTVFPELVGPHSRPKLLVLSAEVGGRWSKETRVFYNWSVHVPGLSCTHATLEACLRRGAMWACAVAEAGASSLLDLLDSHGGDGKAPATHEAISDHVCARLRGDAIIAAQEAGFVNLREPTLSFRRTLLQERICSMSRGDDVAGHP